MKHRKQARSFGHMPGKLQAVTGEAVWAFLLVSPPRPPRFPGSSQWTPSDQMDRDGVVASETSSLDKSGMLHAGFWWQKQDNHELKASPSYTGPPVSKTTKSRV